MSNDVKGGKYFLPKKLVESLLMFVFPPRFLKLSPKFPKTIFHSAHIHTHTTTISGGRGHVLLYERKVQTAVHSISQKTEKQTALSVLHIQL